MTLTLKRRRALIISFAALAVLAVCLLVAFFVIRANERADYRNGDLSSYVSVNEGLFGDGTLKIKVAPVDSVAIEERVMLDLVGFVESDNPAYTKTGEIGVGDKIRILSIKVEAQDGRIIAEQSELVEHFVGEQFRVYGYVLSGMQKALVGLTVGEQVIYARLPHNYHDEALATELVKITLNIEKFIDYSVPEITNGFIKDKLKIESALEGFAGDGLTEKYYAYIKAELDGEYAAAVRELSEAKIWKLLSENTEIKRLPSGDVSDMYDTYMKEIEKTYAAYAKDSGLTLEQFGLAYIEADPTASLKDVLMHEAEIAVGERLAFYFLLQAKGYFPNESELDALYRAVVDEYLDSYIMSDLTCRPEYFDNLEEYEKRVAEHKARLLSDYSEEYFLDAVYSEYGMERLLASLKIENIAE